MSDNKKVAWGQIGTLRDKVALVRCGSWVLGFEARHVRQVGFSDLVADLQPARENKFKAHVGHGFVGDTPCSVWDLGLHLGQRSESRAMIALERPGGLLAFRCGEILAVETVVTSDRLELPANLSTLRRGLFKSALVLRRGEQVSLGYLLRSSALLDRREIVRIQRDWSAVASSA